MVIQKEKNILILGATGMIGHMLYYYLEETKKYNLFNAGNKNKLSDSTIIADFTNQNSIEDIINKVQPDIILNCAGVLISEANDNPGRAVLLNSYLPLMLERITRGSATRLIQFSTDCVFSGRNGPYDESDLKDADDKYGRSKSLGEIDNHKDITIRTSTIGPELKSEGEGLFHWFNSQEGTISGYSEVYWSGVTTLELAKAVNYLIESEFVGLAHLTNGQSISKYNLLLLLQKIWTKDNLKIKKSDSRKLNKSLNMSKLLQYEVPTYEKMIKEMMEWMLLHREIYNNYRL